MKYILSLTIVICFLACSSNSNNQGGDTITKPYLLSVVDFKTKLSQSTNNQLIDVRTPEEFAAGNISGATNIDFYNDSFQTKLAELNKDKPVLVYCKSGGRSGKTSKQLSKLGFKEIYDLKGGYTAWSKAK